MLGSILNQNLPKTDYDIIINEYSKDNTVKILNAFGDEITVLENKKIKGYLILLIKGFKI